MTHKEIANQLGISPAALSLIINGRPGVSAETRSRVLERLEGMGYSHLIKDAPAPQEPQEKKLCFVVYKQTGQVVNQNPFVLLLMEHIESCARQYGYQLLMRMLDGTEDPQEITAQLNAMGAQGILIMGTEMLDDRLGFLAKLKPPCVVMDNDFTNYYVNTVSINNQMGTYQAIEYLVGMGHTRIGYLKSSSFISSWGERAHGFRHALHHFGLELPEKYIYSVRFSEEASYQDFKQLLTSGVELPTALVTDDDVLAVGALRALKEAGYHIPDDISIIGFSNRPCCEDTSPQLTSIDVPKYTFSAVAVRALHHLIAEQPESLSAERCLKQHISTKLIVRESVRDLRGEK